MRCASRLFAHREHQIRPPTPAQHEQRRPVVPDDESSSTGRGQNVVGSPELGDEYRLRHLPSLAGRTPHRTPLGRPVPRHGDTRPPDRPGALRSDRRRLPLESGGILPSRGSSVKKISAGPIPTPGAPPAKKAKKKKRKQPQAPFADPKKPTDART